MNTHGYFDFGRNEFVFNRFVDDPPGLTPDLALQFYRVLVQGGYESGTLDGLRSQIDGLLKP